MGGRRNLLIMLGHIELLALAGHDRPTSGEFCCAYGFLSHPALGSHDAPAAVIHPMCALIHSDSFGLGRRKPEYNDVRILLCLLLQEWRGRCGATASSARDGSSAEMEMLMLSPTLALVMLTAEERTALTLSATGLVVTEVAEAMGQPPGVVRGWLASSIKKLGARSKLEAVLIAARTRQLDPRSDAPARPIPARTSSVGSPS
jgi:hypothetical protein